MQIDDYKLMHVKHLHGFHAQMLALDQGVQWLVAIQNQVRACKATLKFTLGATT
jgi:hypothetical protein